MKSGNRIVHIAHWLSLISHYPLLAVFPKICIEEILSDFSFEKIQVTNYFILSWQVVVLQKSSMKEIFPSKVCFLFLQSEVICLSRWILMCILN